VDARLEAQDPVGDYEGLLPQVRPECDWYHRSPDGAEMNAALKDCLAGRTFVLLLLLRGSS